MLDGRYMKMDDHDHVRNGEAIAAEGSGDSLDQVDYFDSIGFRVYRIRIGVLSCSVN